MSQLFKQISCKSNSNVYAFSIKSFHLYRSYQKKSTQEIFLGALCPVIWRSERDSNSRRPYDL